MDVSTAKALANRLQISVDCVVREEHEMVLLKELYESEFGVHLMFKGGTALRLAYGSPRFSEDLDFTALGDLNAEKLIEFLKRVGKRYPAIAGLEAREKFYTVLAIAKIKEDFLSHPFPIKVEISKRKGTWVQGADYTEKVITSEATPLTVLARVASLEEILREKKEALRSRQAARDVFDYWFINQLLKKDVKPDLAGFDRKAAKSELHRLLTKPYWRVVDSWLE
jgi:predicted nucleotidyltransferase component of viral defense system